GAPPYRRARLGRPPRSGCGRIRTRAGGSCPAAARRRRADLPVGRRPPLTFPGELVVLVLILVLVDDPQGRLLVGSTSAMARRDAFLSASPTHSDSGGHEFGRWRPRRCQP